MAYQRGNYPSAIDYFLNEDDRSLSRRPLVDRRRYNLARTYEASGKPDLAILLYSSNTASPGYHGDVLRRNG